MPVPTPNKGETEQKFVSRCISELSKIDTERPQKQIIAICYSQWRQKESKRHEDFQLIFDRFVTFFGEENGAVMYKDFLRQNGLDETKPYTVEAQILGEKLRESFEWVEPLIKYWKHDKEAKYYKMRLLTANISMNKADYTKPEDMEFAASNMAWRPLDIDHDHKLRLPFPRNRLEVGRLSEEGDCIETVIRIDNKEKKIQEMIDKREIVHPSIEAHPICGLTLKDGKKVPSCGYYIDEVALLRKEYQLPGDPLSYVYPVPLNEALATSLVESLQTHDNGDNHEDLTENITPRGEKNKMTEKDEKIEEQFTDLPDSAFACILGQGDSKIRKLPISDAAHTRNAMARYNQTAGCQNAETKAKICSAAKKFNVQNAFEKGGFCYSGEESEEKVETVESLEEIASLRTEIADLKANNLTLTNEGESKDEIIREKTTENTKLTKTLSKTEKELSKALQMKTVLEEARKQLADTESKLAETKGENEELKTQVQQKTEVLKESKETNEKLEEQIGKVKIQLSDIRKQRDEATEKAAVATTKAINETKERARIQDENADLREEAADAAEKLSEVSNKRVEDSKRIFQLQNEMKELKERDEERDNELKKLRHLNRVQTKVLEKLGYKRKN